MFQIGEKIDIKKDWNQKIDFSDILLLWVVFAAGDHLRQETEFSSHFQNFPELFRSSLLICKIKVCGFFPGVMLYFPGWFKTRHVPSACIIKCKNIFRCDKATWKIPAGKAMSSKIIKVLFKEDDGVTD